MRIVRFSYGVGYGQHEDSFEVDDEATNEEIEEMVFQTVMDRLDWGFEVVE